MPSPIIQELKNDALGSLLHITDIAYYPKAEFHFRKRTNEEAKQFVLIYCIQGSGWFEIEEIRQKVSANHFLFYQKTKRIATVAIRIIHGQYIEFILMERKMDFFQKD